MASGRKTALWGWLYKEAERILGLDEITLRQYKSIAERFELSVRTDNLSWRHHREVSSLKQIEESNGKLHLSNKPDKDNRKEKGKGEANNSK